MDSVLLLKKLTQYTFELMKLVEKTKQAIEERQNKYDLTSYLHLKELSMILSKFLARTIKIRFEVQEFPEEGCGLNGESQFESTIDAANDAELQAQVLLDLLEAKLLYLSELSGPFTTQESVKENSNLVPAKMLSETSNVDSQELETINNRRTTEMNITLESSLPSANEGKQLRRKFEMRQFTGSGDVREFASFWEEFQETVGESSLSNENKFAALRSLVRGEPYKLFLGLNYRSEEAYDEAWNRLFSKYADDELVQRHMGREKVVRSLPAYVENQSVSSAEEWSDAYFFEKYCKSVPNYKTPDTNLVIKAIKIFLKFYTHGPSNSWSIEKLASVWLILIHKAISSKSLNFYQNGSENSPDLPVFGHQETFFSDLPLERRKRIFKDSEVELWYKFYCESLVYNYMNLIL